MAKKRNWELIKNQKDSDTIKYRDVYEDQQLERGNIAEKQSMTSRIVMAIVVSVIAFFIVYVVVSAVQMFTDREGLDDDMDPADDYIQAEEFYYNVNDMSDTLSVEEYNQWYKDYHDYDSKRSPDDEPPEVPVNDLKEYAARFKYDSEKGSYSLNGEEYTVKEYQDMLKEYEKEYDKLNEAYQLYYRRHHDPEYRKNDTDSGNYVKGAAVYRNWNNDSDMLSKAHYQQKVDEYNQMKKNGEISEDILSIPLMPVDYSKVYIPNEYTYVSNQDLWKETGADKIKVPKGVTEEEFNTFLAYCEDNNIKLEENPYEKPLSEPDVSDIKAVQQYKVYQDFYEQLKILFASQNYKTYSDYWKCFENYCDAVHFDRQSMSYLVGSTMTLVPATYRNKFDGTVISRTEYNKLVENIKQETVEYEEIYLAHRQKYHPDDIDGSRTVFSMAPNLLKVFISLCFAGIVFGSIYLVLKRNLTAQNLMANTSDINQYHNDQHIALPEEVQKNYDWFPDVGAHSSVQVSSMISHMAITNKGLKNVTMAKRAKDDVKNDDGDIEYYKGEILFDDDGNAKTSQQPIIDTDFMEALFDASGASKDKNVRHYYDTTKIPYNPGNGNRDKLSGYDTVADLINGDWEMPLYEPQRPGGAYIVDTAPVNTMV